MSSPSPSPSTTRIVMLGTGDFALPTFVYLCDSGRQVVALVTQPDRPQGRKQEIVPSRINCAAVERGIPVFQPEDVNAEPALAHVRTLQPDLLVTAAYGQILSKELLSIPSLGGINLHGSVLPAYRGASPVARAIAAGDRETGVTVIRMTPRIDAGGMIAVARTPIDPDETAGDLEARLAALGAPLVADAITAIEAGQATVLPQDKSKVTRAPKLTKDDGLIDWTRSAQQIHDLIRAMQPWPTASTTFRRPGAPDSEPLRLIVHKSRPCDDSGHPGTILEASADRLIIAAGAGAVQLLTVQTPGKKAMSAAEFLRGHKLSAGERLGQ